MITPDMCEAVQEKVEGSCFGCIAHKTPGKDCMLCAGIYHKYGFCSNKGIVYKLKRKYKPHYRTPPANYRDSENDLS